MVPVAFPHDEGALIRNIAVRREVMDHLDNDGVVIPFPAGRCATARTPFGKAHEHEWNPFAAKMILRSRARVVTVLFPGQNSRLIQFAQFFSATLRQALMMHEIVANIGTKQSPRIGPVLEREDLGAWILKPRAFIDYLRYVTLSLETHVPSSFRSARLTTHPLERFPR